MFGNKAKRTDEDFPVAKTEAEWREILSPEAFRVLRQHGTERPGTSKLNAEKRQGIFACAGCGTPLFDATTKYESGTGWPSFWAPADPNNIRTRKDVSLLLERTEVACRRCSAHLGHVFPDGPEPTHLRYCINESSLRFLPA